LLLDIYLPAFDESILTCRADGESHRPSIAPRGGHQGLINRSPSTSTLFAVRVSQVLPGKVYGLSPQGTIYKIEKIHHIILCTMHNAAVTPEQSQRRGETHF